MSKNKQPKKLTNKITSPPKESAIEKTVHPSSDSIMGFYLRAVIVALGFGMLIWYVVIYGYVDMNEAEKIVKRVNAKDPNVSSDEMALLREAQDYSISSNYKWFHNYKWVYHNLLNKNLKVQEQADTLDLMGRQAYKNGTDFQYIKIILDKTPEDAVILMPDAKDFALPEGAPANTPKFGKVAEKCTYFLYPRTLIYDEMDGADSIGGKVNFRKDPDYAEKRKKVTHVAIVYGYGYEHLNYQVQQRDPYACLPINQPTSTTTPNSNTIQPKEQEDPDNQ